MKFDTDNKSDRNMCNLSIEDIENSEKDDFDILQGQTEHGVVFLAPRHWYLNKEEFEKNLIKSDAFRQFIDEMVSESKLMIEDAESFVNLFGSKTKFYKYLKIYKVSIGDAAERYSDMYNHHFKYYMGTPEYLVSHLFYDISFLRSFMTIYDSFKLGKFPEGISSDGDNYNIKNIDGFIVIPNGDYIDKIAIGEAKNTEDINMIAKETSLVRLYAKAIDFSPFLSACSFAENLYDDKDEYITDMLENTFEEVKKRWES